MNQPDPHSLLRHEVKQREQEAISSNMQDDPLHYFAREHFQIYWWCSMIQWVKTDLHKQHSKK